MELQKTKEELLAFLQLNTNNSSTGIALREFIRENANASAFGTAFLESKGTTEEESSSAESEELEETIQEVREEGRDDEDFIVLLQAKGKKKHDKKIAIVKQSNSKNKRKCEFCGTLETPMWRRGPTGKGTLCNACGVKWSLKFRKRAGKKPAKVDKAREEPREQRLSTRKKIPSKKSIELVPNVVMPDLNVEVSSPPNQVEVSSQQNPGLCCNHSTRKRRSRDEESSNIEHELKRTRDNASIDYDSMSDDSPPSSHQLLGKLLNVVEVQLVEEEELDRVKKQMLQMREEFDTKERHREKQFEQTRANALNELMEFRREVATLHSPHSDRSNEKIAQSCRSILEEFTSSIKNQMDEMKRCVVSDGVERLDRMESDLKEMQNKMENHFSSLDSRSASDCAHLEKLLNNKEENIRNGWAFLHKETKQDFAQLHQKLDEMEDTIHRD